MSNILWLPYYIDYSLIEGMNIKNEISIPRKYDIFINRYMKYALKEGKPVNFIKNENGTLQTNFELPRKVDDENLLDVKLSVKSYKYIYDKLFISNIIPEFINFREKECFVIAQKHSAFISTILEYYLLNNPEISIPKNKKFHDGRLEYLAYQLIQEFYRLGKLGEPDCVWLTSFNSPIEIWFIYSIQSSFSKWFETMRETDKKYIKEARNAHNSMSEDLKNTILQVNQLESVSISTALKYTTARLIEKGITSVTGLYTQYTKTCLTKANLVNKGIEKSANPYRK